MNAPPMKTTAQAPHVTLTTAEDAPGKTLRLVLTGRLDADGTAQVWDKVEKIVAGAHGGTILLDVSGIEYCDGAGLALLGACASLTRKHPSKVA